MMYLPTQEGQPLKSPSALTGLTEDPNAFTRWVPGYLRRDPRFQPLPGFPAWTTNEGDVQLGACAGHHSLPQ